MSKKIALILALLLLALPLAACARPADNGRPSVVATLYPQYDFCKNIAGDEVSLTLLLPPGADAHTYDPTPADILTLSSADLLIYTGAGMELWLDKLLAAKDVATAVENGSLALLDLSETVDLLPLEEDGDEHEEETHDHGEFDPHIWTSPNCAAKMCDAILNALIGIDGENEALYRTRHAAYKARLAALCDKVAALSPAAAGKTVYFGGSFAFTYLFADLSLSHRSLYNGCAAHTEPSPAAMTALIEEISAASAPAVLYDSPSEEKAAAKIAGETGAALLRLHAIHNISKEELERGEDYLSLTAQNLEILGKAIGQ